MPTQAHCSLPTPPTGAASSPSIIRTLGFIPAHADPTFGGRFLGNSVAAFLMRTFIRERPRRSDDESVTDFLAFVIARCPISTSPLSMRKRWGDLRVQGLIQGTHRGARLRDVTVLAVDPVAVTDEASRPAARRLVAWVAWCAFDAHRAVARRSAFIGTADVLDAIGRKHVTKHLSGLASHAMSILAAEAPDVYEGAPRRGGWRALRYRGPHGDDVNAVAVPVPDADTGANRLLALLATRVRTSPTRMATIKDVTRAELAALFPNVADPRKIASTRLEELCTVRPRYDTPLIQVGMLGHCRYVTLPEFAGIARATLQVAICRAQLPCLQEALREIRSCPLTALRAARQAGLYARCAALRDALAAIDRVVLPRPRMIEYFAAVRTAAELTRATREMTAVNAPVSGGGRSASSDAVAATGRWSDLLEEARGALAAWPHPKSASQLGNLLLQHLTPSFMESATMLDGRPERRPVGRYAMFAVRAQLVALVGDPTSALMARSARRVCGEAPTPALLEAGLFETDPRGRGAACIGLGLIGTARSVDLLRDTAARDPDATVRRRAIWALSLLATECATALCTAEGTQLTLADRALAETWIAQRRQNGPVAWAITRSMITAPPRPPTQASVAVVVNASVATLVA